MYHFPLDTIIKNWEIIVGIIVAIGGFIMTIIEYKKSNRTKRVEFLEKLASEFNEKKMYIAKKLLDDFWFVEGLSNAREYSEEVFIEMGSREKKEKFSEALKWVLRDHKVKGNEVKDVSEHRVRESFDELLDFFTKLDYYLSLKLISKKELGLFEYYIKCCNVKADGGVMIYAKAYGYMSLFRLLYVMNLDKKYREHIPNTADFLNKTQEQYYHDLRNDRLNFMTRLIAKFKRITGL